MASIQSNKILDYTTFEDLRNFSIGGVDFGKIIREDHPAITLENYKDYVDRYYSDHAEEIEISLKELNAALEEKENGFGNFIKKNFGDSALTKKYTGYLSIFNCNPRFLENRTFQIYYKKDLLSKLEVCFHEALHFQFFDYCDKKLKKETAGLDKNSGVLWELSEVLNVILMNEQDFRKFFDREETLFYPHLKDNLNKAKGIWHAGEHKIDQFIKMYLGLKYEKNLSG
jgi:hypothetical protein